MDIVDQVGPPTPKGNSSEVFPGTGVYAFVVASLGNVRRTFCTVQSSPYH